MNIPQQYRCNNFVLHIGNGKYHWLNHCLPILAMVVMVQHYGEVHPLLPVYLQITVNLQKILAVDSQVQTQVVNTMSNLIYFENWKPTLATRSQFKQETHLDGRDQLSHLYFQPETKVNLRVDLDQMKNIFTLNMHIK